MSHPTNRLKSVPLLALLLAALGCAATPVAPMSPFPWWVPSSAPSTVPLSKATPSAMPSTAVETLRATVLDANGKADGGDPEGALAGYRAAMKMATTASMAFEVAAEARGRKATVAAGEALRRAFTVEIGYSNFREVAERAVEYGENALALEAYGAAREAVTKLPDALELASSAHQRLLPQVTEAALRKASELANDRQAHTAIAERALSFGMTAQADAAYQAAQMATNTTAEALEVASSARAMGRSQASRDALDRALSSSKTASDARIVAERLVDYGETALADGAYKQAAERSKTADEARDVEASARGRGRTEAAKVAADKLKALQAAPK